MKYVIFLLILFLSCKGVANNASTPMDKPVAMEQQGDFIKMPSKNYTYILNYQIKQTKNSPVTVFTYYVTSAKTDKIVRDIETIAAEKIYWKDDITLAIVPYVEVIKQNSEVGVDSPLNEVLIKIK